MNRFRNMTLILALLLVTLLVLAGIRGIERKLDTTIDSQRLRFTGAVADAPPAVAFTTMAMGSFRGLLADILWLRSEQLKGKKNYFEMVQLARWITDLQPNYSGGTVYLAWNLAYNISVTSSDREDRWYWVNEGIKLVRDKALLYNPDDPLLYRELSWIYLHKLGNLMDDMNLYYKSQLAEMMTNILGSTTPDWEKLAAAPKNKEAFMELYPEDSALWKAVEKAGYKDYDALFEAFRAPKAAVAAPLQINAPSAAKAELPATLRLYLSQDEFAALDSYFRAELLRRRLKLEPARMVEIDKKYGKMDWRVPESQAIYWATVGVEKSIANTGKPDINCLRIISHGLQSGFRSGRLLTVDATGETISSIPNLNLTDSAYAAFEQGEAEFKDSGAGSSFRSAKINYLKDAIPLIYIYGNVTKAQEFFDRLVSVDGPQKQNNLDEFVMVHYAEDVRDADVKKASAVITGLVQRAIFNLLVGQRDSAVTNERLARYIHRIYTQKNFDVKRNTLAPFAEIKKGVVTNLRNNLPPMMKTLLEAEIAAEEAQKKEELSEKNSGGKTAM
ncbi:MAG: hypothetical protein E7051_05445 [Lentisphaerae bacterium]|nr:hypothetical protein [Lentisphaerota bacterium]MBQ4329916.1 hypothetical protein [Lentisphaeria bacterium]MBR2720440.1 hypothetical protein [Lentisphaeria bacterium]